MMFDQYFKFLETKLSTLNTTLAEHLKMRSMLQEIKTYVDNNVAKDKQEKEIK